MRIEPLGDRAWILRDLPAKPANVARAISAAGFAGVTDVVPCLETVGVYGIGGLDERRVMEIADASLSEIGDVKTHHIPVCYNFGPDLDDVCGQLGLSILEVINLHSANPIECFAIGFCPGFAYLGPVPEPLRGIPRMASPRTRTEPGSVGITGNQTAVYPLPRPGGWPIIGKTPLVLVDEAEDYYPISVGDFIQFEEISAATFYRLKGSRL